MAQLPESARIEYLNHALTLSKQEMKKIVEYASWLPAVVIDSHAHANQVEHVESISQKAYEHMMSTFPSFTLEESQRVHALLHPETAIRSLRFAHVFRGIAHRAVNSYLLENCPDGDLSAIYGLPDDIPYTVDMLADPRVAGLKMYYSYLEPSAEHIYEIFKPEILAAAQEQGVPIILHTPKIITESIDDVINMTRDFPNLKVSIAHLGSSKFDLDNLQDTFEALAEQTNVVMDTALNPSPVVVKRALQTLGADRILFGSDEPLNLIRSVPYNHPKFGPRITTTHRYHWQDKQEHASYNHLANGAVHSHWLCLDALKTVIDSYPLEEQDKIKQRVFHDNAKLFFGFKD